VPAQYTGVKKAASETNHRGLHKMEILLQKLKMVEKRDKNAVKFSLAGSIRRDWIQSEPKFFTFANKE